MAAPVPRHAGTGPAVVHGPNAATGILTVQLGVTVAEAFTPAPAYAYAEDRGRLLWPTTLSPGGCGWIPTLNRATREHCRGRAIQPASRSGSAPRREGE
jgi:hypothetical protein